MIGFIRSAFQAVRRRDIRVQFKEAMRLQWMGQDELRRLQLKKIQELCLVAHETTPYYQEAFKKAGMKPEDIRSFENFAQLPLLTKDIIRERLDDMINRTAERGALIENFSGGSTGSPLRFFQDRNTFDTMQANILMCMKFAGWRPADMVINIWGNPRDSGTGIRRMSLKEYFAGDFTFNAYRYGKKDIDQWVRFIRTFHHVVIYGYVSALQDVAGRILETGVTIGNVRAVMTSAEKLYDHQRALIARAFGCRVYDQYGSREIPGIAAECECGGMHLLTHSAYVEFVPDPVMEANRLVVTCLTNAAMPFLRYEIGDYASPLPGACACGRGFPLMRMDIGRVVDCLVSPSGQRMYGTFFVRQLYGMNGVEAFQFRQSEAQRIELFVVRGPAFDEATASRLVEVKKKLEEEIPGVELTVRYVPEIPKTQGGKHRQVVCEVAS